MNSTQRVRTQRPSMMTHDDVIQMMTVVNVPRSAAMTGGGARTWKRSGQHMIRKSGVRSAARCRDMTAAGAYDDDAARTRKYWEDFAREATRDLLKDAGRPGDDSSRQRIMYSGRVGIEPKYPPKIADGDESTATDLSLLTCSELAPSGGERSERRRRRQRRNIEPDVESKTNWAEAVKDSYGGVLGRMLEKDAGTLHVFTDGGASGYSVLNKANISKLFSEEEQRLLMNSAYMRGLHGKKKSASTENIVTGFAAKRDFARFRKASADSVDTWPSPSADRTATKRSASLPSGIHAVAARGRRSSDRKSRPRSIFRAEEAGTGYPAVTVAKRDSEGDYARHLQAQIYTTVTALDRMAGFGDKTSELNTIPEERGLYTGSDYARVPRYPQNIRVAPQLVHVITSEVKKRVSQPRQYELRQQDVYRFDRMQPSLDRASRNLFIFNWLNQLSEGHFRAPPFPELRRTGGDDGDDVTEIVFTGSTRSRSDETGSDYSRGQFDNESFESSDVSYDDDYDVDSCGPAIGSVSDQSQ